MSEEHNTEMTTRDRQIELLKSNSGKIQQVFDDIEFVFEDVFGENKYKHNNYDDYSTTMRIMLSNQFEISKAMDISEAIINVVGSFDKEVKSELEEEDPDLGSKISKLVAEYQLNVQRRSNIVNQGPDYWSNVKTEIGVRSNRPKHSHEFIRAHDNRVKIDSSMNGTLILAKHFLNQIKATKKTIGEDTLDYIREEDVGEIVEIAEEIREEVEQYDGTVEPRLLDEEEEKVDSATDESDPE